MMEGYLQTKIRSQEDQIRELQTTITTLRITVESLGRRANKLEEDTRKVTDIDGIVQKLMSLNEKRFQKELDELTEQLENCIIATTDKRLEDYNKIFQRTNTFVTNFWNWFQRNNFSKELQQQRCHLLAVIDLLESKKLTSSSDIDRVAKAYQKSQVCNKIDLCL